MPAPVRRSRPQKPSPDFPLFAHSNGYWARKVGGKLRYYKKWSLDPEGIASMAVYQKEQATALRLAQPRPDKPYPEFPLNAHANGSWYKYIGPAGGIITFGSWRDDPRGVRALEKYIVERDDLYAGRNPRIQEDDSIALVLAAALREKEKELGAGAIAQVTFDELKKMATLLVDFFGPDRSVKTITPSEWSDFKSERIEFRTVIDRKTGEPLLDDAGQPLKKVRAPDSITNMCVRVKTLFNVAEEYEAISSPPRYRSVMKPVKEKHRRKARNARKGLIFTAGELRRILDASCPAIKAMGMVAINVGIGNKDIALARFENFKLDEGILDYARLKTEVERVVPLWSETIAAIREYLIDRPEVAGLEEYVFVTQKTRRLYYEETISNGGRSLRKDSMGREFTKTLKDLGMYRKNLGFYTIRRTFQTIGDETGFESAVKACMAHADQSRDMSARYRQTLATQKAAVVNYVRDWFLRG